MLSPILAQVGGAPQQDWVKSGIESFLTGVQGKPGDITVLVFAVLMFVMLFRKRFRSAVGFLFLIGGLVAVRVMISFLFGMGI